MTQDRTLEDWARAAAAGDRTAAERLLGALQNGLYRLALRMLGHPEDAEDATQEILLIVLTHLGSFRGDSSFRTWSWRIAANHLLRVRRGRMERFTFESITAVLEAGLRDEEPDLLEAEASLFAREVRLRCTQAMVLSLDRDLRIAFVLGDIFCLTGEEAARVLDVDAATYRKRLSRARTRLLAFLRARCGLFDASNGCRCTRQIASARERGLLRPDELLFARHPVEESREDVDAAVAPPLERCRLEVDELLRLGEVIRHPEFTAPPGLLPRIRGLLDSGRFALFALDRRSRSEDGERREPYPPRPAERGKTVS